MVYEWREPSAPSSPLLADEIGCEPFRFRFVRMEFSPRKAEEAGFKDRDHSERGSRSRAIFSIGIGIGLTFLETFSFHFPSQVPPTKAPTAPITARPYYPRASRVRVYTRAQRSAAIPRKTLITEGRTSSFTSRTSRRRRRSRLLPPARPSRVPINRGRTILRRG
jgi:hypothetical protein